MTIGLPSQATAPISQTSADLTEVEERAVIEALRSGRIAGGGSFTQRVERILREQLPVVDAVLTTSGTDALELAAMLLDIQPGDTVIVPSFTFSSAATAFIRSGAKVRFADIEETTLGIDPRSVEELLDETVRAVVPVHYAGIPFDIDGLLAVLEPHARVALVEDNAHGLFGTYRGQALGTFGVLGATSFHATKNLTCGEGGAVLINDPHHVDRAHILAEKGTDRRDFERGAIDKYSWRDTGSSFVLADPLAAILEIQLRRRREIFGRRRQLWLAYLERLAGPAERYGLGLPGLRAHSEPVHHLFYVLLPDTDIRNDVMADLNRAGIGAAFHYLPLHRSDAALRYGEAGPDCPVSVDVSGRLLRLPFHTKVSESEVDLVVSALVTSVERRGRRA